MDLRIKRKMYAVLMIVKIIHAATLTTKFARVLGDGRPVLMCFNNASSDRDVLGVKISAQNVCSIFDTEWGQSPTIETGSTYFVKKHVIEIYESPMALGGAMTLPIVFFVGAHIDMLIEFTRHDFSYGVIQLVDTMDESFKIPSGVPVTLMVNMEFLPLNNRVFFKAYGGHTWVNLGCLIPYPFPAGETHKISFRALTNDMQILIDDSEVMRYRHFAPPQSARMMVFSHVGFLLHRIEFIGV